MAGALRQLTALVFDRHEQGERYWRYHLLCPESGPVEALWRRSTKLQAPTPPDLFDEIEGTLEASGKSKALFFREHRVRTERHALARHYASFREASRFTRTLWRNLAHAEELPPLYQLSCDALDAFTRGLRPEVVHLKALYRFAKQEGYPVKEEWWTNLPAEDQERVAELLQTPTETAGAPAEVARRHLQSLQRYLRAFTEILIAD